MTILIAFLGALGFSLLLSAALFPFEKLTTAAPAAQSPLDRADAISGEGTAQPKEVTIFHDKSILDRILSPWIVELTRRIKPQWKADLLHATGSPAWHFFLSIIAASAGHDGSVDTRVHKHHSQCTTVHLSHLCAPL